MRAHSDSRQGVAAWKARTAAACPAMLLAICMTSPAVAAAPTASVNALTVRPGFYMLDVDGTNVALETGPQGAVVIDTGPASASSALLEKIRELSKQPIRFVIDTSADRDLIGGNEALSVAGRSMTIGWVLLAQFQNEDSKVTDHLLDTRAPVIARQATLAQLVSDY